MNYSEYFTKDMQAAINSMSNDEMKSTLLELEGTIYWIAVLKYFQSRVSTVQSSLSTIDPISNTTDLCRSQGILMGLSDLQAMIITLLSEKENKK